LQAIHFVPAKSKSTHAVSSILHDFSPLSWVNGLKFSRHSEHELLPSTTTHILQNSILHVLV